MANIVKVKRSATPAKVPTTTDLALGEIAVNTFDGKMYIKKDDGTQSIVTINPVAGSGDVVGPSSATDNAIARFDTATGKLIQSSVVTVSDTGDIAGAQSISNLDYAQFDTTVTPVEAVAKLQWDDGNGTLQVGLKGGNVNLQIGEEIIARVYNDSGVSLVEGQIVYISGAQGNRIAVKLAKADSDTTSAGTLGMVTESIAIGAEGFITMFGTVNKLNTSSLTAGAIVYLSPTTAGAYTTTKPVAPQHIVTLGYVERISATVGSIYIKVDNGYELDELHNVLITSPTSGNTLIYDAVQGVWENANITAGTGISVTNGAGSITIANTGVTSVTGTSPISSSGGATPAISISQASSTTNGYLSSTDWNTFNNKTSNTGTVTSITAGTGLSGGTITTSGTISLANTAVTAGSYTNANITVDAQGRITAASNGAAGGVTSITGTANQITASASTGAVTLSLPSTINVNTSGNAATATTATNQSGGTVAATTGSFSGITSITNATASTNSSTGALVVTGGVGIGGVTNVNNYINRITGSGNSAWLQQDGTGRVHWYWNTYGGTSPTFTNAGEDASAVSMTVNNAGAGGNFFHRSASGVGQAAGAAITWTTTLYTDLNSFTWKGNTVLRSDNYNSYSPTLTGTGASGTWGIAISGNAATATNASYAYNYTQGFASNWNTDFSNTPAGSTKIAGDTSTGSSTGGPGGTWWFQQNMRHTNASNVWGTQVAWGWEDNANVLKTRNVQGGTYGSWVTYLNSANYNSYSPTLTGTGASGTWGISVTGTSANVTGTVAIANGGTGATTAATALTNLGAYAASNPSGYTSNMGTVTSVGGTGSANGLTLSGTVTTTGNLTLGGSVTSVASGATGATQGAGTNNTTLATTAFVNSASIGPIGANWNSVARSSGTTYTNTTGHALACWCQANGISSSNSYITMQINGGAAIRVAFGNNTISYMGAEGGIIVPAGATYVYGFSGISAVTVYELY